MIEKRNTVCKSHELFHQFGCIKKNAETTAEGDRTEVVQLMYVPPQHMILGILHPCLLANRNRQIYK